MRVECNVAENKRERPLERQTHNISGMTVNPCKGIVPHPTVWSKIWKLYTVYKGELSILCAVDQVVMGYFPWVFTAQTLKKISVMERFHGHRVPVFVFTCTQKEKCYFIKLFNIFNLSLQCEATLDGTLFFIYFYLAFIFMYFFHIWNCYKNTTW